MSTKKPTMKLKDAAALLTVCGETLRRMAVKCEIPALQIRTRWALPTLFVEDWIAGNRGLWEISPTGTWIRKEAPKYPANED